MNLYSKVNSVAVMQWKIIENARMLFSVSLPIKPFAVHCLDVVFEF